MLFLLPLITLNSLTHFKRELPTDQEIRNGDAISLPLLLKNKQEDFYYDVQLFKPETVVHLNRIDNSYSSVFKNVPFALKNVLIAPVLLSFGKWEMIPFAFELLLLYFFVFLTFRYPIKGELSFSNFLFAIFLPSVSSLLFLGLTVPISGLIVKYSAPIIPFIFLFLGSLIDWDKLNFVFLGQQSLNQ